MQLVNEVNREATSRLERHGLFATRNSIEEAFQYADELIETLAPEDRVTAYTAMYVLYNSVVKHVNKEVE